MPPCFRKAMRLCPGIDQQRYSTDVVIKSLAADYLSVAIQADIVLAIGTPAACALRDNSLDGHQVLQLDIIMAFLQCPQVIDTVPVHQLAEDVFIVVASQHETAIRYHTGWINNNDAAIPELGCHVVANDPQRKQFTATITFLHPGNPIFSENSHYNTVSYTTFLVLFPGADQTW